jgi:hypothetical protein
MNLSSVLAQALSAEEMRLFELFGPPTLVVGEDGERYCRFVVAILRSVAPTDVQDFIFLRDLIDLEWDVLRYRAAKAALIGEQSDKPWHMDPSSNANSDAEKSARAVASLMPKLRQLDLMIESAEIRRDRAYRELERRRANLAARLRGAVKDHTGADVVNDHGSQRAA